MTSDSGLVPVVVERPVGRVLAYESTTKRP
jgi:hypothetical protein